MNLAESLSFITDLLQSTKDIVACLLNCSNNGICQNDSNGNYFCSCFQYYSGYSCETDLRKCSKLQCLYNGICTNLINGNNYDFNCTCKFPYYGKNCQLKQNLCKGVTCSKKGVCYTNETTYYCKCFKGYSGQNCELESRKPIKKYFKRTFMKKTRKIIRYDEKINEMTDQNVENTDRNSEEIKNEDYRTI